MRSCQACCKYSRASCGAKRTRPLVGELAFRHRAQEAIAPPVDGACKKKFIRVECHGIARAVPSCRVSSKDYRIALPTGCQFAQKVKKPSPGGLGFACFTWNAKKRTHMTLRRLARIPQCAEDARLPQCAGIARRKPQTSPQRTRSAGTSPSERRRSGTSRSRRPCGCSRSPGRGSMRRHRRHRCCCTPRDTSRHEQPLQWHMPHHLH